MGETFGQRLRTARGRRTQAEVASICGVEPPAFSMWENDRNTPTVANLVQIADYLGVRTDWLLRGIEPMLLKDALSVDALVLVIEAVFSHLRRERRELAPQVFARVVSALYHEMTTRPESDWRSYLRGMIEMAERK